MTPAVRVHLSAQGTASGARGRAVCGARVLVEQLATALTAVTCERCRAVISSPAHAREIADQLLATDTAGAWRRLAVWIERGVIVGGPPHLTALLGAVRVELDLRSPPVSETSP